MYLVLYADIYGFSDMIIRDREETFSKIQYFQNEVRVNLKRRCDMKHSEINLLQLYLFSDNLLLIIKVENENDTVEFFKFVSGIIEISMSDRISLPLRGCVEYGKVEYTESSIIGECIIDAVEFEKHIMLPMIFAPIRVIKELKNNNCLSSELEQFYKEPVDLEFKDGISSCYVIAGENDTPNKLRKFAQQYYESYREIPRLAKPAKAWKSVYEILKKKN